MVEEEGGIRVAVGIDEDLLEEWVEVFGIDETDPVKLQYAVRDLRQAAERYIATIGINGIRKKVLPVLSDEAKQAITSLIKVMRKENQKREAWMESVTKVVLTPGDPGCSAADGFCAFPVSLRDCVNCKLYTGDQ